MVATIQEYIIKYPVLRLVILICIVLFAIWVVKMIIKKAIFASLIILLGVFCFTYYKGLNPTELAKNIDISKYTSLINSSKYIKLTDKGLKVKLEDDTWISLSDITSYYTNGGVGDMLIKVGDTYRRVADRNAINLIKAIGRN